MPSLTPVRIRTPPYTFLLLLHLLRLRLIVLQHLYLLLRELHPVRESEAFPKPHISERRIRQTIPVDGAPKSSDDATITAPVQYKVVR